MSLSTHPGMPPQLAGVFEAIQQQFQWLHVVWKVFRQLYVAYPERVDLLNESAPLCFRVCQDAMLNDIVLALSRLTDPAETYRGKENLTLERLVRLVDPKDYPALAASTTAALATVNNTCAPFRTQRNRNIAHNDLQTVLKMDSNPLPGISDQEIQNALESIDSLLNLISVHFNKGEIGFEYVMTHGDGEDLIICLKEAKAYRKHDQENTVDPVADGVYL